MPGLENRDMGAPVPVLGFGIQLFHQQRIPHRHLRPHIRRHPQCKVHASIGIQRNGQYPAQHAPIERSHPLRAVLRPKHHPVARADASLCQQPRKPSCQPRNLSIRGHPPAHSAVVNHRDPAVEPPKIIQQCSEVFPHGTLILAATSCPLRSLCSLAVILCFSSLPLRWHRAIL